MSFNLAMMIAAVCGFISLSYEIIWFRAYAFATGGVPTVFGVLLGFYLAGIALGSLLSQFLCKSDQNQNLSKTLFLLACFVFVANIIGFLVVPYLAWSITTYGWVWSLTWVAVAAGSLGATLPLVAHYAIPADNKAGARVSYLYIANILGSTLGSLTTGFVLMDFLSMEQLNLALLISGIAVTIALFWMVSDKARKWSIAGGAVAIALAFVITPTIYHDIYEKLQMKGDYQEGASFKHIIENRHGVITVTADDTIYGGGIYDGKFNVFLHEDFWLVRPYFVGALNEKVGTLGDDGSPQATALMIGLSSGSWAQIAVHLPGVKKLTIIEINPGYGELIEKYDWVKSLLTNPKVELVFDDGRRWLQRNPDRKFDVIFQNTTQHWRAHSTNLLSLEYLELSEKRLLPGGMVFYNTTWSEDALRTGAEAFPYAMRVINFVVGSNAPIHVDKERWEQILRTMRIDDTPILPLGCNKAEAECQEVLETFDKLIAFPDTLDAEPVKEGLESRKNLLARMDHARVITDDNMRSEWYRLFW